MRVTEYECKEKSREDYYAGKITAEQYIEILKSSEEGDRERLRIVKEFRNLVARIGATGTSA